MWRRVFEWPVGLHLTNQTTGLFVTNHLTNKHQARVHTVHRAETVRALVQWAPLEVKPLEEKPLALMGGG